MSHKPSRLVVASRNAGKAREVRMLLAGLPLDVVGLDAYPDFPDTPEPHDTFVRNAMDKALAAARHVQCLALADDSGWQVEALDGRPGVQSARYGPDDAARIRRLLEELKGVPAEHRRARFVCALVLASPEGVLGEWQENCAGLIALQPAGHGGFGFDPVFLYEGRTFAQMTPDEKNAVSHRGKSLRAFGRDLPQMVHDQ